MNCYYLTSLNKILKEKYSDSTEEKFRFEIFKKNLKIIEELNSKRKKESDAFFKINKFIDKLPEELPKNNLKNATIKR